MRVSARGLEAARLAGGRSALRALNWRRAWGDDWNHWWKERFDGYRFLPVELGDCVELGCGPYTNTRLVLAGRRHGASSAVIR